MPAAQLAKGTIVAGRLRVVRLLGSGGMAAVYEVEHQLTKHRRALKLLHPEMLRHPSVVARFLREASAAGHIANPHVVETFDAGSLEGGEPYIVMEMLEGETLAARFDRDRRLPLADLANIVAQACDGIEAAHTAGIVHRDVKPDNIFLVHRAEGPFVKVLDFGISKFDPALTGGHGMTKEGATIGTPFYMAPEQVTGSPDVDARVDVYALGVILYEGLAGTRPFDAEALPMLSVLIHEGKPKALSEHRPDLPPSFLEVVRRAMAPDRAERFATAKELAASLAPFRASALDQTIPEGTISRTPSGPPRAIVRPSSTPPPTPVEPATRIGTGTLASHGSNKPPPPRESKAPGPLSNTAPLEALAREAPPGASEPPAEPDRALVPSMSGAARSVADEAAPPARGRIVRAAVLISVVLGVAATVLFTRSQKPEAPAALVQSAPATSTPSATGAEPPLRGTNALPSAPSVESAPSVGAIASAPDAAAPLHAVSVAVTPSKAPATPPRASASTRVDQKGLSSDNPF